jgi:hypothetical protein
MLGILLLISTGYLSGYPLYRLFFRKTSLLESALMPQILSLIATPMLFTLLYLLVGFNAALYLFPLLSASLFLLSLRVKQERFKIKIDKWWVVISAIAAIIVIISPTIINMTAFSLYADPNLHASISNFINDFKILPPDNPCIYGQRLNYQWFYHLTISLISSYSGIGAITVLPYFTVYLMIIFLVMAFLFGHRYFKSSVIAVLFMVTLFVFFSEYYLVPQTQGYAFPLIILFLFLLHNFTKEENSAYLLLAGIIVGGMMYIHALSFIFLAIATLTFAAHRLIFHRQKKTISQLLILIFPISLAIPYFFIIGRYTSTAFIFEPLAGASFNYPSIFGFMLIVLPFAVYYIFKSKNNDMAFHLMVLISLFAFVNTLLMRNSHDILRFVLFMVFPIALIDFECLKGLGKFTKYLAILLIVGSLLILHFGELSQFLGQSFQNNFYSTNQYVVSDWLYKNSLSKDTILTSPLVEYSLVSHRHILMCEPFYVSGELYNPVPTFLDLTTLYTQPSRDLILKYNISYVVVGNLESNFFGLFNQTLYGFEYSTAFTKSFAIGNSTVFAVSNLSALPPISTINYSTLKDELITAYPARWWFTS